MSKVNVTAGQMTDEEIKASVDSMVGTIKSDSLPAMKPACSGVSRKQIRLTEKEIDASCKTVLEDVEGQTETEEQSILRKRLEQFKKDLGCVDQLF